MRGCNNLTQDRSIPMTDQAISPLRRRMIEDMTIRKISPKTQQGYIRTIKNLAAFLGRSPDTASFEDIRRFQLHLATSGAGTPIRNQAVAALRFFFRVTLKRYAIVEHTAFIHEPRKMPVVVSPEDTARVGCFRKLHTSRLSRCKKLRPVRPIAYLKNWCRFIGEPPVRTCRSPIATRTDPAVGGHACAKSCEGGFHAFQAQLRGPTNHTAVPPWRRRGRCGSAGASSDDSTGVSYWAAASR